MKKYPAASLLLLAASFAGCVSAKRQEIVPAASFVRLYEMPPSAPSHNIYRGTRNGYAIIDTYSLTPTGSFAEFERRYLCPILDLPVDFRKHVKVGERISSMAPAEILGWQN